MFTLHVPIALPDGFFFTEDGRVPVPPLLGHLKISFAMPTTEPPFALKISGFETIDDARAFLPRLKHAFHWASIQLGHSVVPDTQTPSENDQKIYNGNAPQVMLTTLSAQPMFASATSSLGTHLAVLSGHLNEALESSSTPLEPRVSLAMELFARNDFVGGSLAQFVMLFTALEVLVDGTAGYGKRGPVLSLVNKICVKDGRTDGKGVVKRLDGLYRERNDAIHFGQDIGPASLKALKAIVKDALRALATKNIKLADLGKNFKPAKMEG
jgi:hypothetical protein